MGNRIWEGTRAAYMWQLCGGGERNGSQHPELCHLLQGDGIRANNKPLSSSLALMPAPQDSTAKKVVLTTTD